MKITMAEPSIMDNIDTKNNPYFAPADGRCLINDFPPELLSHIFSLGAESEHDPSTQDEDDENDDYTDDSLSEIDSESESESESGSEASYGTDFERQLPFELLVSRVCKRWREIAVEISTLWSTIVFTDPFNLEKAREYVRRAKGAPLDISIDCTVEGDEDMIDDEGWGDPLAVVDKPQFKALGDVLELLKPHVEQWKTFELMVSHYLLMDHALAIFKMCPGAPILEVLGLYHYEESEENETFQPEAFKDQDFVLFQNNLPRLKEVKLWGVHVNWPKTTFLSGLEDIEFAYHAYDVRPSYNDFLRILKSSPSLHTLTLCQSGPAGMPVDWLESVREALPSAGQTPETRPSDSLLDITVPSIIDLALAFLPPEYVLALLDHIRLPNITKLALDFDQDEYTYVVDRLSTPAAGTSKSLFSGVEALKLSGLSCAHVPTLVKAAGALQNLKHLNINFHHVEYFWLGLMIAPETVVGAELTPGTTFFPRLESISITNLDGKGVRELVQRRKEMGKPLKEVYLNREDPLWDGDEAWLKENLEVFETFEGSDDEDVDDVDDVLDLDDVDDDDIIEDDEDENWTDEDDFGDEFDDDDDDDDFDIMQLL